MKNLLQHTDSFEKLEDLPSRERVALGGGHWGRYKGRDYPHNKVHRFLESRVGVKWDDVFSEFVHLTWIKDEDKTREKIGWDVVFDTMLIDGKVHYLDESWGCPRPIGEHRWKSGTFYVHPVTKCLGYAKPQKKEPEKKPETLRILGDYHQLIKVNGIWHEVKGIPVESDIVIVDGLHYRKVKTLPESKQMTPAAYPPFPQKFFGRKVMTEPQKYKKTADGYYLIPEPVGYYSRFSSRDEKIGPREAMILTNSGTYWERYSSRQKLQSSVKITMNRQLSSKELKKYGLKNDFKATGIPCKVCGNVNCCQEHNNRCNVCGEKWCRTHAVKPYTYAMGLGNPIVK